MNQAMVVHQVQHDFDRNVIVIMKQMKSNRTNISFFLSKEIIDLVHNDEINIIHINHQFIWMKMLMINFMMKINGK
jgi:hypothetical protein